MALRAVAQVAQAIKRSNERKEKAGATTTPTAKARRGRPAGKQGTNETKNERRKGSTREIEEQKKEEEQQRRGFATTGDSGMDRKKKSTGREVSHNFGVEASGGATVRRLGVVLGCGFLRSWRNCKRDGGVGVWVVCEL